MMKQKIRFIDLFAGIGGFRLAFEEANYECVFSCEINKACQDVYYKNFKEKPEADITKININALPDFEVLTAGFPCQPFSICGRREGFEDARGTLFFNVCQIIAVKRPRVVLLENVKYLIYHDQGRTLSVILSSLNNLGYQVNYQILNGSHFGLPQHRERLILIAIDYESKKFDFNKLIRFDPIPKLKDFLVAEGNFEKLAPDDYTLIPNPVIQKSGLIFAGYRNNKSIWKKGVRPNTNHLSRVHRQPNRIYSAEGVHPTLPSQETSGRFFIYIGDQNIVRKLTITECYKIMGFGDDFILHDNLSECYKQVGNSIPISMIYQIANQIKSQIFSIDRG